MIDANAPIDLLVDSEFPEHSITREEWLSNEDIALAGIFYLKDEK